MPRDRNAAEPECRRIGMPQNRNAAGRRMIVLMMNAGGMDDT
jgi:hypothetical protein